MKVASVLLNWAGFAGCSGSGQLLRVGCDGVCKMGTLVVVAVRFDRSTVQRLAASCQLSIPAVTSGRIRLCLSAGIYWFRDRGLKPGLFTMRGRQN